MSELPTYILDRTFNAPRELVWKTWTDPELLARWYGPNIETIIHKLDIKPGGLLLLEMKMGNNSFHQRGEYTEVTPPEKLVFLLSTTDSEWNIIPSPMMKDWPKVLTTTVTFEEEDNQTNMRLTWVPHDASEAEINCFATALETSDMGWPEGMKLLEELLAELQ